MSWRSTFTGGDSMCVQIVLQHLDGIHVCKKRTLLSTHATFHDPLHYTKLLEDFLLTSAKPLLLKCDLGPRGTEEKSDPSKTNKK